MINTLECPYSIVPKPEKMAGLKMQTLEAILEPYIKWSGIIPDKLVNTGPYKVRGNYFAILVGNFQLAQMLGMIKDSGLNKEVDRFITDYSGRIFPKQISTAEDIQRADELTARVLSGVNEDLLLKAARRYGISSDQLYGVIYGQPYGILAGDLAKPLAEAA
ncbi:MAG: hypothetical protein NUV73_02820 [Candidatus Daviesbacteria bacterium]|nr:hypothetical protein [Candidatus Daviesbacteria bacterium]